MFFQLFSFLSSIVYSVLSKHDNHNHKLCLGIKLALLSKIQVRLSFFRRIKMLLDFYLQISFVAPLKVRSKFVNRWLADQTELKEFLMYHGQ